MTSINRIHAQRRNGGFTLVEIIIVLVVTGILSGIVAIFVRTPVLNYLNAKTHAELSDAADTALRRMRRDVRLALPNSVRLSDDGRALEFILTKAGGRYLSADDDQAGRNILSFTNPAATSFDIVGAAPSGSAAIAAGDMIAVYNLGPGFAPADAYGGDNIAIVSTIAGQTVTLDANVFAMQTPSMESPTRRFQVVSGPVTYYCNGLDNGGDGTVMRYSGYILTDVQVNQPVTGTAAMIANNVASCSFAYDVLINEPKALVGITLKLRDPRDANVTVTLSLHVHVDNTP